MGTVRGTIVDAVSGEKVTSKVHAMSSSGRSLTPNGALMKQGPGVPFFYCDGEFEVNASRGQVDLLVERGTEYTPYHAAVQVDKVGTKELRIELQRWADLPEAGWYPGNTHIHYDQNETRAYDRLKFDSTVEHYNVTAVSILKRWGLDYKSNKFPLGVMTDYSTAHHVVDVGEESRHNEPSDRFGYGHVMFLNIRNVIEPVSRGSLVDNFDPDYPPLCFACDDALQQGGLVIWCHNGQGLEAPVAAALGKLHAFNLFDPFWMDPEYDIWYQMMNCGFHLHASTGTDWFVCSNNRVYVQLDGAFSYEAWIEGMKAGRTFITNGPALFLEVDGQPPGASVDVSGGKASVRVRWASHYPLDRIEIVQDGAVVKTVSLKDDRREGAQEVAVPVKADGWIAARCWSTARDSFSQAIYAHTSPAYVKTGVTNPLQVQAARLFLEGIDAGAERIRTLYKFTKDEQREAVMELFGKGRKVYEGLVK